MAIIANIGQKTNPKKEDINLNCITDSISHYTQIVRRRKINPTVVGHAANDVTKKWQNLS